MQIRSLILPALLAATLAAGAAHAQAIQSPANQPAAAIATKRDAMVERRITELRTRLKVTPAEQKPFDDFAQTMRDNAARMSELVQKRRQSAGAGTAVDQMKIYGEMAQAHAEDMQRLIPAFGTLYDTLSPDQKKAADQSFREFANGPRGMRG